jgi:hypothetical protein
MKKECRHARHTLSFSSSLYLSMGSTEQVGAKSAFAAECSVCVPEEWPPGELEDGLAEEGAHPDHEEDVEDGRAHDGPDPHICIEKMQCKNVFR